MEQEGITRRSFLKNLGASVGVAFLGRTIFLGSGKKVNDDKLAAQSVKPIDDYVGKKVRYGQGKSSVWGTLELSSPDPKNSFYLKDLWGDFRATYVDTRWRGNKDKYGISPDKKIVRIS